MSENKPSSKGRGVTNFLEGGTSNSEKEEVKTELGDFAGDCDARMGSYSIVE